MANHFYYEFVDSFKVTFKKREKLVFEVIRDLYTKLDECEFYRTVGFPKDETFFLTTVVAVKLGLGQSEFINEIEKDMIDDVFLDFYFGPMEKVYELIEKKFDDRDYYLVQAILETSTEVAIAFLSLSLCIAFADGVFEENTSELLDSFFEDKLYNILHLEGIEVGMKAPVQKEGIEKDVLKVFIDHDIPRSVEDVAQLFPEKNYYLILNVLNNLCDKKALYKMTLMGEEMFALDV